MPQKIINVPGIGDILVVRLRKSKSVRLSISHAGKVRVSQPYWAPYITGTSFARRKTAWIQKQLALNRPILFKDGVRIGKQHTLYFKNQPRTRITKTDIIIPVGSTREKILTICEKALRSEAEEILPQRLGQLANEHGFLYSHVRIRKLTARWGSCSAQKSITLSYFLIQPPWHLIDYVLIHELVHTKHLHHGRDFWQAFLEIEPNARQYQKEIRQYKPRVEPRP
jgi:predicted metal-dependent hydrolase